MIGAEWIIRKRAPWHRLLPYLFILYSIAFLDRVNISYAALEMTKDLGFTAEVMGFGAGIFFFGYFLLEIPGSLLVETWSARGWIARIMISWGILAILMGFIHTANPVLAGPEEATVTALCINRSAIKRNT